MIGRPSPEVMVYALGRLQSEGAGFQAIQKFLTDMGYTQEGDLMMLKQVGKEFQQDPQRMHDAFSNLDTRVEDYVGTAGVSPETRGVLGDALRGV